MELLQLYDKNKKKKAGLTEYKDLCIESVLITGDKKLSFSYPKNSKYYDEIVEEAYLRTKTQEFVIKARDVGIDYTHFDCVLNLETLEANIFDRFESVEQTITASLNLAIVGTGWTVKDNTLKKNRTVRCTNKNALEIIQEIKKTYRVDIVFNTLKREIEVYEHLGEDKGTYFIDSLNLTALQVQSDSYKFATRIIAEGKDGLSFADINGGKNYVENYQYSRKVKTIYWKDERYTIKENLLEDARAKLEEISKPFVSYNASILNLAELNPKYKNILDYRLGDTITLISRNNKVKDKQRIVKTLEYPQDHSRDTVELANAVLKFEDIQQENQETTDTVNNITTDNGTVDGSTIDSITTKQIEDFKANVIQVTNLHALNADIDYLKVNKADMQDVNIVKAKIGTLETTKASITELTALKSKLQQAIIMKADITDLNAANGKIAILESKTASIDNLLSQKASINDLNALNATISEALIKKATIAQLEALETKTNNLIADKANIKDLNVINANINSLKTYTADIKTLLNGNLSSENIQTKGITSDKLVIANGFIKDAMIDSINVNKLNAGVLTTDKFNIRSRDGNLIIKDNTIQIKDSSKVRVQVGKDASGDYSLYVWDKLGNLMFNALGITKDAIKDKIIRNDMVSDDAAIEGKKLNIESVIREVNNGKSNLKASKIDIDTKGQTLDIAFSNLVTENGKNKEELVSLITKLNVQQGQINASIENSKVLEGKQKTLEDNYNRTVVTVDSLKNTMGSHKTLIDSATGKITSVEIKANTLEKNLSGLTQTVTDTKKVIENNKTVLESKNAELKASIDSVSSSLSAVSSTVDKNNKALVSKTTTLEQTLSGLTQTVSSNKAAIDGKITSVENVTHELMAGLSGLTSKLDTLKSTTDGINKTVSNQGSVINQLKDSINLKVDSSTFTQSTAVINNNINRAKEEAINSANNAINNLQISFRNLAINSNFDFGWKNWGFNNPNNNATVQIIKDSVLGNCVKVTTQTSGQGVYSILKRKPKTTYSWSFMIKSDKPCKITVSHEYGEGTKEISLTTEWTKITGSGIWNGDGGALCFYSNGANPKITYYLTNLIYVEGDKVGNWTPAPDDLQAYAEEVAKAKADLAKTEAIANSDGKITTEEQKRIQQAQENLNIAISKADKAKQDAILEANRVAELKKQEAINSANSHADNKANEALNNAKAFVNAEITTVNSHLNKATSEINVLKEKIESKVSQSDIDKSIQNIKFNDVNMILNSGEFKDTDHWSCTNGSNNLTIENRILKFKFTNYASWGCYISNNSLLNKPLDISKKYTVVCKLKASKNQILTFNICDGDSNNHVYARDLNITTEWKIFKFTFKPASIGNERQFRFITGNLGYDFDFYIEFVKMVEGATSSDSWSMAPDYVLDNIKTVTDKITTVESKLTQENNSIKASVQDLNSTTQTITTNVSNINRDLTSKINSNLDAAKSFATDIAIAKANLAKEQAIANADGKITAEEQKRIQQAQDNLNAAISKATEAEIKAKSYADVKKQEAINSANNNTANTINNLDIGIYNLANESGNFLDNTGFFVANGGTLEIDSSNTFREYNTLKIKGNSGACYKDYIELQGNTTYCYSCWIKSDRIIPLNVSTPLHMWVTESKEDDVCHREIILKYSKEINSNWQQVFIIFKTPSNKDKYIMKPFIYGIGEATVWLANFQVKKGSILNDWTPNPNDLKRYSEEVAKAKAELAKQQAIANADGKITEEERKRIQQAQENLNVAIARADKAKQEAINSANSHADSKANEALNNAKAYTNAEITTVNSKVHNVESNLNILSDRINTKVSQSDIDKAVTTLRIERIIYARGTGNDYPANSIVKVNGKTITDGQGRGLRINALNKITLERVFLEDYDTYGDGNAINNFANKINELNNGDYIIIVTSQDASYPLNPTVKGALEKIGATLFDNKQGTYREAYALIGKSKLGRGNGVEMFIPRTANDKRFAEVSVKVGEDGTFIGVNPNNMGLEATLIRSNISNVSSELTQTKNSIEASINSINSKTQSIETNLNGKATKQEVTEVNNRVATIKANLDSITQRVSNTESKINTLDGKVAGAVTLQQFTEFKQSNDKFKFTVEQRSSVSNILPNSSFHGGDRGWLHGGVEFWAGAYSGYGFKGRITGAIKNRAAYNNPERYLQTHKAYKVKKNTTYTINFHYICEKNVQSMDAFVVLSDTEHGDYAQPICVLTAQGGSQSNATEEKPFTYKFNTGNHEWVWIRFDHNGMKSGVNWDEFCWVYVSEIGIYEGDVGAVKWTPKGGEVYSANYQMDGLGFKGTFEDGTYASLGKDGLEWYNAGTGHAYHALTYVTSFDIPIGNPGKAYIKLPAEFTKRRSSLKWTVALRGYYYSTDGDFFPFHIHCTGGRDYIENGLVVCEVQGYCKIQNAKNSGDIQFRPLTAMLIAIA